MILLILILYPISCRAQFISSGTFIAYIYGPTFFAIGADSQRAIPGGTQLTAQDCKLVLLSDDRVFTLIGFVAFRNPQREMIFNPREIARRSANPGEKIENIANRWGETSARVLTDLLALNPTKDIPIQRTDLGAVTGLFAGVEDTGEISAYRVGVFKQAREFYHQAERLEATERLRFFNYEDLVREFVDGTTERAKAARSGIPPEGAIPMARWSAIYIRTLVKFVIDYSGSPEVGGDPAVGILEAKKKWTWIHRPDFYDSCNE